MIEVQSTAYALRAHLMSPKLNFDAELFRTHPVLHHYTDINGLTGILESQSLWATHYKALNDFSEIEHIRPRLESLTYQLVNELMRHAARESLKYRRFLDRNGGLHKCSRQEARTIIQVLYQITFEGMNKNGGFAEPYVVSFCAHSGHSKYVKQNGLLSQWRGYGSDGGYALVFDTKSLWVTLKADLDRHFYAAFNLADVVYGDISDDDLAAEIPDLTKTLNGFLSKRAEGFEGPAGELFTPFFNIVTRFKHEAFKEESEVRLAIGPLAQKLVDEEKTSTVLNPRLAVKPVLNRNRRGINIPYIALNDFPNRKPLPIRRIIVGPQRDQQSRALMVKNLVHGKIEVVCSKTPFVPM